MQLNTRDLMGMLQSDFACMQPDLPPSHGLNGVRTIMSLLAAPLSVACLTATSPFPQPMTVLTHPLCHAASLRMCFRTSPYWCVCCAVLCAGGGVDGSSFPQRPVAVEVGNSTEQVTQELEAGQPATDQVMDKKHGGTAEAPAGVTGGADRGCGG